MTSSPAKTFFSVLLWTVSALGFLAFFALILSPAFEGRMDAWATHVQTVPAHVQSCELQRDGNLRENVVRCMVAYTFQNTPYVEPALVWRSENAFDTRASLAHVLQTQVQIVEREARMRRYAPHHPEVVDTRWITAPPLWMLLALLFVGCMAVFFTLVPSRVERRSDMMYTDDPETGRRVLATAPGKGARSRGRLLVQSAALTVVALLCVYALLNRPANALSTIGLSGLQPVPARLVNCSHHWHGTNKGNDMLQCDFTYSYGGAAFTGRADTVDFRLFPTTARMDAKVAEVMASPQRVAMVDPAHPTYAIAFVDNSWVAMYSWGLLELMVAAILSVLLPSLVKDVLLAKS